MKTLNILIMFLYLAVTTETSFASVVSTGGKMVEVSPPTSVKAGVTESDIQIIVFEEEQYYDLSLDLAVDIVSAGTYTGPDAILTPGIISAGTRINSYMIHFDPDQQDRVPFSGSVTFEEPILGLIVLNEESYETLNLSDYLGAFGTLYPTRFERRTELLAPNPTNPQDQVILSTDRKTVTVTLLTSEKWQDQVRIITGNQPPIAICKDVVVAIGEVPNVDGGSYDPDGDPIILFQYPSGSFAEAGIHDVTLTVTDDQGASDNCIAMVVVYDPYGGFVTGGGWIDSPEGAYMPDPSLTGKANFGFVSKYKKGATMPTGETEFVFKAGYLNFHSDSYEWLVVAGDGHKAMFKGVGTINGAGNYGFILSAIDAAQTPSTDIDLFRIKIWDKNDGDTAVYDNQMGDDEDAEPATAIGGGSIVIHTK